MKFGLLFLLSTPNGKTDKTVFEEILREIDLAEEVGFDSVWLTEHHFTNYGRPSLPVLAGAVASRTKRIRIGTAVSVLPLHHPIDIAEDFATVDVISNGRLDFGIGRGYQPFEFFIYGVPMNDTRERLAEALDIILKSWTQEEFTHEGKYYNIRRPVSVLPKPIQKPHPGLWQPVVSPATAELLASHGINPIFGGPATIEMFCQMFWDPFVHAVKKVGKRVEDFDYVFTNPVFVAETNATAKKKAEGSIWWPRALADLATTSVPGHDDYKAPEFFHQYAAFLRSVSYDDLADKYFFIGDPDTVTEKIRSWHEAIKMKTLLCSMHVGTIPHKDVMESMKLFARTVIPTLRGLA
jgi:alkanesulfonate monooxygenase SsuD/methylene tetrahydromethanopterin reductase-like flavin-dependent oxidoreductase (luciferase family)